MINRIVDTLVVKFYDRWNGQNPLRSAHPRSWQERVTLFGKPMGKVIAAMRQGDALRAEQLRRANIRSSREYLERFESFVL